MASVFKPIWTRVDPKTGELLRLKSSKWYVKYRDADGILRRVPGFKDKEATRQRGAQLEKQAALRAVGVVDRFAEHRKRPLLEHIDDFAQALTAKGNTSAYVDLTKARTKRIVEECGFRLMGDLDPARLSTWVSEKRTEDLSLQSLNFYIAAAKGFCRWLVRSQRLAESPLAHMGGFNVRTDRRHDRRALTGEEFGRLLAAARGNTSIHGLSGDDRALLYTVAANTGLRASELRSLTEASFDFGSSPPTVAVEAGYSKHRRRDVLPLREDLVELIKSRLRKRKVVGIARSPEPLWPGVWHKHAAEMVRADLSKAEIEYTDAAGRVFDFHAFRHQFLSNLAQSGAHPKATQSLARHSTITLTMDRYAHLGLVDMSAALKTLPALPAVEAESSEARATGTDGRVADLSAPCVVEQRPANLLSPLLIPPADFSCPALSIAGQPAALETEERESAETSLPKEDRAAPEESPARPIWRRHPDSNRGITVLQTVALATWLCRLRRGERGIVLVSFSRGKWLVLRQISAMT